MRLLVTRPAPDGERTAARLRERGHEVLLAPLLQAERVAEAAIPNRPWAGVLVTSANAVRALPGIGGASRLAGLPVLAVGEQTAQAAREAGFTNVEAAEGDADALVRRAASLFARDEGPLLYLAGEQRAREIAGPLAALGFAVETVAVYRMRAAAAFPPAITAALAAGAIDGVLHYSARTADAFLACAQAAGLRREALGLRHYCLSAAIAGRLRDAGAPTLAVAAAPNEPSLLALIEG